VSKPKTTQTSSTNRKRRPKADMEKFFAKASRMHPYVFGKALRNLTRHQSMNYSGIER
jgi:hypothetical protein